MAKQANSAQSAPITELETTNSSLNEQIKEYLLNNLHLKLTFEATTNNFLNAYILLEDQMIEGEWIDDSKVIWKSNVNDTNQ
jgi:hypothetical protein